MDNKQSADMKVLIEVLMDAIERLRWTVARQERKISRLEDQARTNPFQMFRFKERNEQEGE